MEDQSAVALVAVFAACIVGRLLAAVPPVRRLFVRGGLRLGAWLLVRFNPPADVDPVRVHFRRVLRRQRLQGDVERLRILLATDMNMSGTRQLGNRIAYEGVLVDLARVEAEFDAAAAEAYDVGFEPAWSDPVLVVRYGAYRPQVEVLDVGW